MTALERLIANCNSVIGFLRDFSRDVPQDVQFEWIKEDDSTEVISFANIKKFQQSVNAFYQANGQFVDSKGELIALDAQTLNGKTAADISENTALKFRLLFDVDSGGFPERFSWGVTQNNEIVHWGRNYYGVSGDLGNSDDTTGYSMVPQPYTKKGVQIQQIFATTWSAYVLYEDGDLYGVGYSVTGQIGQGNTATQNNLVFILSDVDSIAASSHGYHQDNNTFIAIKRDASVWSWGYNGYGQCGNGNTTVQLSPGKRVIEGLRDGEKIIKAYVCCTHVTATFLLSNLGRVFSCGWNGDGGALGLGDGTNRTRFELVSGLLDGQKVVSLSVAGGMRSGNNAYYRHSVVALTDKGDTFSWGYGVDGELGLGNTISYNTPQRLDLTSLIKGKVVRVFDSYGGHTSRMALTNEGELVGWGRGHNNCLGRKGVIHPAPFKVALYNENGSLNNTPVKQVQMVCSGTYSYHHTSYIETQDGRVFSAGYTGVGQLGRNTVASEPAFKEIRALSNRNIVQWSFGGYSSSTHVQCLLANGKVVAWGDNGYQQSVISRSEASVRVPQYSL